MPGGWLGWQRWASWPWRWRCPEVWPTRGSAADPLAAAAAPSAAAVLAVAPLVAAAPPGAGRSAPAARPVPADHLDTAAPRASAADHWAPDPEAAARSVA